MNESIPAHEDELKRFKPPLPALFMIGGGLFEFVRNVIDFGRCWL